MNVAVFADVHGRLLLCFKLCARWEQETGERLDLILQAGDLGAFPDTAKLDKATIRHAEKDPTELGFADHFRRHQREVAEVLDQLRCDLVFVRGNHEDHQWLDGLEQAAAGPIFPIDHYQRVYCLKSGVPYTFTAGTEQLRILGIGRIGPRAGESAPTADPFIQPHEAKRLHGLEHRPFDVLLTHDSALDFVTPGFGMAEIRTVLDTRRPRYHIYGHTGQPYTQQLDANRETVSCKCADLNWDRKSRRLCAGAMALLRWQGPDSHQLSRVDEPWVHEYTAHTWRHL